MKTKGKWGEPDPIQAWGNFDKIQSDPSIGFRQRIKDLIRIDQILIIKQVISRGLCCSRKCILWFTDVSLTTLGIWKLTERFQTNWQIGLAKYNHKSIENLFLQYNRTKMLKRAESKLKTKSNIVLHVKQPVLSQSGLSDPMKRVLLD